MLDSTEWRIIILARWGFFAKTIAKAVRKYDGTHFSESTIYRVLKKNDIKLTAYRNGQSDDAKQLIDRLMNRPNEQNLAGKMRLKITSSKKKSTKKKLAA